MQQLLTCLSDDEMGPTSRRERARPGVGGNTTDNFDQEPAQV